MGQPDQFLKQRLELDTRTATGARVVFERAPEIRTDHLTPDGILVHVRGAGSLDDLPDPWPRLEWVAVLEGETERDHHDALALARAELRRHACWVRFLDLSTDEPTARARRRPTPDAETIPETARSFFARLREQCPPGPPQTSWWQTWMLTSHLPDWLRQVLAQDAPDTLTALRVTRLSAGCYQLGPRDHRVLWIAANELPLHPALEPFLWARSGQALEEFVAWWAQVQGVAPVAQVLLWHPHGEELMEKVFKVPTVDEAVRRRAASFVRIGLEYCPELADELKEEAARKAAKKAAEEGLKEGLKEGVKKGVKKGLAPLTRLFARRLGRALTEDELRTLTQRLDTHGPDRLGDVVLDLTPEQLATWIDDPHAK